LSFTLSDEGGETRRPQPDPGNRIGRRIGCRTVQSMPLSLHHPGGTKSEPTMAITQDRLVQLLAATNHYKKLIDENAGQARAIAKAAWMTTEEKFEALRAMVEGAAATTQADQVLANENAHYKAYGKANERKKLWREARLGPKAPKSTSEPRLATHPEPELQSFATFDNMDDEILANYRAMPAENRPKYFRDADEHARQVIAREYPEVAKLMESELSTQQMEADMQRNPQDFFRAFAPEAQPEAKGPAQ